MSDNLMNRARALGLHGLIAHWDEVEDSDWLTALIAWEEEERRARSLKRRLADARLGEFKPLADFNWDWPRSCDRMAVEDLMSLSFLNEAANVVLVELLANNENLAALADLSGMWIDRVHDHDPPRRVVLDMDSSVSPTFGEQEGTAYNGHFGCTCYHPLFVFNQFGDLERCALRPGNVHSAHGWRDVLVPVVERYKGRAIRLYFRGDAAFASPEIYDYLEAESMLYAIRLPANKVLQQSIAHLLKRPVGRPPKNVRWYHASFSYQAGTWGKPRRVVAKVEWHPGELYPRVGFIVTNLGRSAERVVAFYNQRDTAEQWIKEGKNAIRWTRLSCRRFDHNAVRLQLHALAYNLGNLMRTMALPEAVEQWSLTSLREKLIKIGAKIVRHGRYVTFQMAEVVIPRDLFADILRRIDRLRPPPAPA